MLSILLPSSPALHFSPMKPSSFRSSKNSILIPRLGPKFHLGVRSKVLGWSHAMTELTRFAAVGGDRCIEEDGGLEDAEPIIRNRPSDLHRGISWGDVESVLNGISKWLVAGVFGLTILWKHDAEVLWAAAGSVLNVCLSITLKRILNHERPVSGLRSDPGMPSSHAQSIFYVEAFAILSLVHWMGVTLLTVALGSFFVIVGSYLVSGSREVFFFIVGSYLSWLRISQRLHTLSQVLVGALLGAMCGITWFWLWHSCVLGAFISSIWVRILVVLGSVALCVAFMVYAILHWLGDEP